MEFSDSNTKSNTKFIAIEAYLKKKEKHQINNLTLHLKQLEKEEKETQKLVEGINNKNQSRSK